MKKVNLPYEIWKDIKGYEGLYQVSNWGRVKSLKYGKERILKPQKDRGGYLRIGLYKDRKFKLTKIHRLVAEAFLENPDNLPEVNHRDENKKNNRVENLEWCTHLYNQNYGTRNNRIGKTLSKTRTGIFNTKCSKPVYQYTLDGVFVREWPSVSEVERQTGWWESAISSCCNNKKGFKTAYGFKWSYTRL